jgi:hypothetical protein
MVTRPDAEDPIHAADRAAHRGAGNSPDWTSGGIAFRRAAPHSSNDALRMNRDRRGEQSRNRGKLQNFSHFDLQIAQGRQLCLLASADQRAGRLPQPENAPHDDSIDHLNNPACSWIDQNWRFIDNRVAVAGGNAIFPRHRVIGHSGGRQDHANPRILAVTIRGAVFAYHIVVKARDFIDAQQAANPARDTSNDATDRATNGAAYGTAFGRAAFRTGGNALSLDRERRGKQSRDHGYSEFSLHRISPYPPRLPG